MREPVQSFVTANGLRHAVHTWDGGGPDTVVLCHGFLDHGRAWDFVVSHLPQDWHVVAFDWRGHGQSEWIGPGGYYHFLDYVMDLDALLPQLRRGRLLLCGHSMGGSAVGLYAGARPERVDALAIIEGLGPPAQSPADAPARTARWLDTVPGAREASAQRAMTPENAAARLRERHGAITAEQAAHLVRHGTRAVPRGLPGVVEGGVTWSFDPLHRTPSPSPFYVDQARAFWRRITCPTRLVEGEASFFAKMPDLAERRAAIPHAQRVVVAGAGHMLHLEAPREVAAVLRDLLVG